jgi:hypothetical protein
VQAKSIVGCPAPVQDRMKAAECSANLTTAWNACALPQVGSVSVNFLAEARKCFQAKTGSLKPIPIKPVQGPKMFIPPGGFPKPGH